MFLQNAVNSLVLFLSVLNIAHLAHASKDAEEARWLVQSANWGTLSWLEGEGVSSMVTSCSDYEGRVFVYIPYGKEFQGSMTFSEASLNTDQFEGAKCGVNSDLDPEDPRCAKLTVSGPVKALEDEESIAVAKEALFTRHPQMKNWPEDHGFIFHELIVEDVWMIADFGGGADVDPPSYYAATPTHHLSSFGSTRRTHSEDESEPESEPELETDKSIPSIQKRPEFKSSAAHARWLVSKSLWTTVSTVSSRLGEGASWGNIRSVVDGECFLSSTGLPYFYLPTPDPTSIDIKTKKEIALSFSEAALYELVGEDGLACGGEDPEDPTCAKISLQGHARALTDEELEVAKTAFGARHPRASWLAGGGAHTGGGYYTIHITSIEFFSNYGGMDSLTVSDYLNWKPDPSDFEGEEHCSVPVFHTHPTESESTGAVTTNPYSTTSSSVKTENMIVLSASSLTAFVLGTLFGLCIWGPILYHKCLTGVPFKRAYESVKNDGDMGSGFV